MSVLFYFDLCEEREVATPLPTSVSWGVVEGEGSIHLEVAGQ